MAPYSEQPGLEVGAQPTSNDKYIPGALLQGYSTAAMAHTSTNFHPATEGHALHLASEGISNGEDPFSNSAHMTPNLHPVAEGYVSPAYSSHLAPASSISHSTAGGSSPSAYTNSNTAQPLMSGQYPSDFSRSKSASSANQLQRPQKMAAGYAPSDFSGLPGPYEDREKGQSGRTICGLGRAAFLWLLALATVILVAGIGGGVGGTMAVNNAKKEAAVSASRVAATISPTPVPTSVITSAVTSNMPASTSVTPTPTSSSGAYIADPSPSFIARDCTTPKKFTGGTFQNTFNVACNQDFTPPVISGNNDIIALTVYSVSDCAKACFSYNRNIGGGNPCIGAAFNANWSAINKDGGNCWLKNTTSAIRNGSGTQVVILLAT